MGLRRPPPGQRHRRRHRCSAHRRPAIAKAATAGARRRGEASRVAAAAKLPRVCAVENQEAVDAADVRRGGGRGAASASGRAAAAAAAFEAAAVVNVAIVVVTRSSGGTRAKHAQLLLLDVVPERAPVEAPDLRRAARPADVPQQARPVERCRREQVVVAAACDVCVRARNELVERR